MMRIHEEILEYIKGNRGCTQSDILGGIETKISLATLKRRLDELKSERLIVRESSKYTLSLLYKLLDPIDVQEYFKTEIDDRKIENKFNFELIHEVLNGVILFTESELEQLNILQEKFVNNTSKLTDKGYKKEMQRLAIDLSWKSSQIEGNTYSLLETERLLNDKETAIGKTKEEAIMLLNHKEALDFLLDNPDYLIGLVVARIEDIHSFLTKGLDVDRNIRREKVGITGTNYVPLDNEFVIRDVLEETCKLINQTENIFQKALLALLLISYIQPFEDGNKRTARIISNAIFLANGYCPISFRTVDSIEYKKAMLIFYEQNNISAFKKIFIDQVEFAVNTYF